MSKSSGKKRTSLLRRLVYFVIVVISGGGAGGYAFQDHPIIQSLLNIVTGNTPDGSAPGAEGTLVTDVIDALKPGDSFSQPGLYQVTITKVTLDQKLFRPGHTVDIQARVRKLGAGDRDATVWDAKSFGSRLAVVGRDELIAGWPDRPFQVAWKPGDQFVLEVYDARTGLFIEPRRFTLAQAKSQTGEFPLRSGDFPLEAAQQSDSAVNPRTNHVVLKTERLRDLQSTGREPTQVAERPIVIK